ncbi:hypothetical protein C1Y08_13075 [Pseudomonas sp. FW306-02-F02-AA]|uniref:Uncharacterized protein n=1 Tax=Pseudomonas fluorescens TaxID=294 RepID=A0A0N9VVJ7_PSEFL|nr:MULTISPECIES: hypothetical protein [Pseudomonas]ALI02450.1 hypothetical protein AO353_15705 [Pseudomonas fluorescens]PMZ03724.1 hypothetical protein C1Y07_12645 [Pseudomonas sp. FW306-02-F02-AB]PMZ10429.1 hypothetical protein C1Y06_08785 [Pseudomonas sp. FW306-02-H06C]PMZ15565.1 hypothetical protein C1Y08_13075 [Pseudomonas sp. FW306-02-F02-AA]PMZ22663.1 hypothetical protein C1Y09_06135 [Pseudomonas sp. FW306-02-F08-AA]
MSEYGNVPRPALANSPRNKPYRGGEPTDLHAKYWSQYPEAPAKKPVAAKEPAEPGFYIVQEVMPRSALESALFDKPDGATLEKFKRLNPHVTGYAKPGQLIVLSDPNNPQCTREEALLMEAAQKVDAALKPMSDEDASFMVRHRSEIESILSKGSTSIGVAESIFAKNLEDVKTSLKDIETLHQKSFQRDGHLRSPEFFAERARLFAKLDRQLTGLTRKGIGFPDHPSLKTALGISSKSLVHHWGLAGAPGQIPGYATHSEGVAKAAKVVKYGGWIGTAVGGGASYMKVQEVCAAGNKDACEKIKYTESGNFVGGVAGGAATGAFLTGSTAGVICVGLGVPTGGMATLACGVIVVAAGSYAGGALGGATGEWAGEKIYEAGK